MQIESVRVRKIRMPRTDPTWRTASYAASELDGCTLEIGCAGKVGIGAATAHPNGGISADDQIAQINGPVRNLLVGADVLTRTRIIEDLRAGSGASGRDGRSRRLSRRGKNGSGFDCSGGVPRVSPVVQSRRDCLPDPIAC
jgi:hypothetical protein